jgi:hypothetical protein
LYETAHGQRYPQNVEVANNIECEFGSRESDIETLLVTHKSDGVGIDTRTYARDDENVAFRTLKEIILNISTLCPRYRDSPVNGDPISVPVIRTTGSPDDEFYITVNRINVIRTVRITGNIFCPDNECSVIGCLDNRDKVNLLLMIGF